MCFAHKFTVFSTFTAWDKVNIDTRGLFPVEENGNEYFIVIVDCFSHFVMHYASIYETALSFA